MLHNPQKGVYLYVYAFIFYIKQENEQIFFFEYQNITLISSHVCWTVSLRVFVALFVLTGSFNIEISQESDW